MRVLTLVLGTALLVGCKAANQTDAQVGLEGPVIEDFVPPAIDTPPTAPQTLPAGRLEDIDFDAYSQDLAGGVGLQLGENRLDSIDKIRLYFAPEPGVNIVNMTSSSFERNDGSVLLFARNNIPDDAIFAEEVYAVFSGPGDAQKFEQKLAAYGLRLKCRRGDNAMEWTTNLCP